MANYNVYTIDVFYGDKFLTTLEIEETSEYNALVEAKSAARQNIVVKLRDNETNKEVK